MQGYVGFGRSASTSALHNKQKGNPLQSHFGDSGQKPAANMTANNILQEYNYGSAKKKAAGSLEYQLPLRGNSG